MIGADKRSAVRGAILDDYRKVAPAKADWAWLYRAGHFAESSGDHITEERRDDLQAQVKPFDILCVSVIRERTPIRASLIKRRPNLGLIVTIGLSDTAINIGFAASIRMLTCGFLPNERKPISELTIA